MTTHAEALPPPVYNFERIPVVHGRNPLWAEEEEGIVHTDGERPHAPPLK